MAVEMTSNGGVVVKTSVFEQIKHIGKDLGDGTTVLTSPEGMLLIIGPDYNPANRQHRQFSKTMAEARAVYQARNDMNIPNHINSIPDDEYVTIKHNKGQVEFSVPAKDLKTLLNNRPDRSISAQVTEEYRERRLPLK